MVHTHGLMFWSLVTTYLVLTRPSFAICSTSEEVFCLFGSLAEAPSEGYSIDKPNNCTLQTRLAVIHYFLLCAFGFGLAQLAHREIQCGWTHQSDYQHDGQSCQHLVLSNLQHLQPAHVPEPQLPSDESASARLHITNKLSFNSESQCFQSSFIQTLKRAFPHHNVDAHPPSHINGMYDLRNTWILKRFTLKVKHKLLDHFLSFINLLSRSYKGVSVNSIYTPPFLSR